MVSTSYINCCGYSPFNLLSTSELDEMMVSAKELVPIHAILLMFSYEFANVMHMFYNVFALFKLLVGVSSSKNGLISTFNYKDKAFSEQLLR